MVMCPQRIFFSTLILTSKADGKGTLTFNLYSTLILLPGANLTLPSVPNTNLSRVAADPKKEAIK